MEREKKHRISPKTLENARSLRRPMSVCEKRLWSRLRGSNLAGLKFRRQHPIGPYIADFYCAACRLVVELDGCSHDYTYEQDVRRTQWLEEQGYQILRFSNERILADISSVTMTIAIACGWDPNKESS